MKKRSRKRKGKTKKEIEFKGDAYILSPEGLVVDYFNHFLDLVATIETMNLIEESGEKEGAAEWKQKLTSLLKDFKPFEAYVIGKVGTYEPDQKTQLLNEISKKIPSCASENDIDFKRMKELITEGIRFCLDEERASSFLKRIEAAFSPFIPVE